MHCFFVKVNCFVMVFSLVWCRPVLAESPQYAAVVIDDTTGKVLHAENAYEHRHPASLTKKMTLYLLFEALRAKKITLKTQFSTSSLAARQIPCKLGLEVGHTISVEDIIKGMITKSANDASVVIAEGLAGSLTNFVALMNKKAKKLGMKSTRFYNPSGVPDARQITTAMDMAILARALHRDFPEYYFYFKTKYFHYKGVSHRNHNRMLGAFRGMEGLKTGFVNASGFNISTSALRYDDKMRPRRLFAVVMGGKTGRSRDKRTAELLEAGFHKIGVLDDTISSPLPLSQPKIQSVSYDRSQKRPLQSIAPRYHPKDAQLLEASLKTPSSFPNIIEPISESTSKSMRTREPGMILVSATMGNSQRVLPPGWFSPKAPSKSSTPPAKKKIHAVRLKK